MNQVWLALITGLTSGGISCFAVQGGLLASSLSNQKGQNQKLAVSLFLIFKIVAYTILGAVLGSLGSSLVISPKLQGLIQIFAGLFMLITVGKLLEIHPVFRYFTLTPPKALFRIVRSKSFDSGLASASLLGFLTVLIPCGVTQAMMLLSVASGSPLYGSLILGMFVLGTSPVFFALGIASGELLKRKSLKFVTAGAILILALVSINTGQVLRGSVHTFQNYWLAATGKFKDGEAEGKVAGATASGEQDAEITVTSKGYSSNIQTLKAGVPVNLKLIARNVTSCARAFTIPDYNISKVLPANGVATVEFTPTKKGRLTYTCSMGMYTGYFEVI